VLGETYAQWPMLENYAALHAADGIKDLIQEPNAYYSRRFMPNGDFTSIAITGLVTGLSEVNQHVNYVARSLREAYPTAMAPQFKRLGYAVDFWYGGVPSWEGMDRFSIAQGFDHFYGYPDFHAEKVNAWGTSDEQLFSALFQHLADEPPTVHLIMTVSNHPPYNIDVAAEGFDLARARAETAQLLAELLPELIRAIPLPNSMRWGDLDFRFIRPIRWIVALYGTEVVSFTLANVTSGNTSRGHRTLAPQDFVIASPADYEAACEKAYIIVDQERWRAMITEQIAETAKAAGGRAVEGRSRDGHGDRVYGAVGDHGW